MENLIILSTILTIIISSLFYNYSKASEINGIKIISLIRLLNHLLMKNFDLIDFLKDYKEEKVVYIWLFGWKLLILDHKIFKEIFVTNRDNLDRGDFSFNKSCLAIKLIGEENLAVAKRNSHKRSVKVIMPYLKSDLMKKNIDICVLENINDWKGEVDVIDKSNQVTFSAICQTVLGYNGKDVYDEFNYVTKICLKWYNLILPFHTKNDEERVRILRNKLNNKEYSNFVIDMIDGGFSEIEVSNNISGFLIAGLETTSYSLTRCIYYLGRDVSKQSELRSSPEMIKDFIKYILLVYPPVNLTPAGNKTLVDINVQEIIIPKNTHCVGVIGIMNDESIDESFTTFSLGSRSCPGSLMTIYELESFIKSLLERYSWQIDYKVDENSEYPFFRRMKNFKCNFVELEENKEFNQFEIIKNKTYE
ncbi:MAG: hypothetical protein AD073_000307 [Mycoplasmataceae bacterium]|nr:MAG: hypothetical protein AD073_000307 [Mycoplasmataceae bacterium]